MHQSEGRFHSRVLQVEIIVRQIARQHHAFVYNGPTGHGRHVEGISLVHAAVPNFPMTLFAYDEKFTLKGVLIRRIRTTTNKKLPDSGFIRSHTFTQKTVVDWDVTPAKANLPFGQSNLFDRSNT